MVGSLMRQQVAKWQIVEMLDLSELLFITTANEQARIPPTLPVGTSIFGRSAEGPARPVQSGPNWWVKCGGGGADLLISAL